MGNSSVSQDPEIRAIVYKLNSYFKTKSTLIYQINLIKQKLNSRNSFSRSKDEKTIQEEIVEIPKIIQKLQRLSCDKKTETRKEDPELLNFSEIFERKELEISELEENYLEERRKYEEMVVVRDQLAEKVKALLDKKQPENEQLQSLRKKLQEINNETENLRAVIAQLNEDHQILNDRKAKIMIERGVKRKNYLKQSLNHKPALDFQSKQVSKQELTKTIHNMKIEQDQQISYFQERNRAIQACNERQDDEEMALNIEISQNHHKIENLQWEIEQLQKELLVVKKDTQTENYFRFESPVFFTQESDQGSLGNSFTSLLDGLKDYRLETEAVAEENEKLRNHVKDIFSVKRAQTVEVKIN